MIGISKLITGRTEPSDRLRYERQSGRTPRPVVVLNLTRRCNLYCAHCYAASTRPDAPRDDELRGDELHRTLDDLAELGAPVVLFSGGEPLLREDLCDLIAHASSVGLRASISTNGTLIDAPAARRLAEAGAAYVGVSIDGLAETNDVFRGVAGAFDRAVSGIRNCRAAGLKVGLRMTMTRRNLADLSGVFDLLVAEDIPRVCFYHLAYTGRGEHLRGDAPSHEQTRDAMDLILSRTADLNRDGNSVEVLSVDNHADAGYVLMHLQQRDPQRAPRAAELLRANGGNASGERIACVGPTGDVHPDPFWRTQVVGNVRQRSFGEIWTDDSQPLLARLRQRPRELTGRCSRCRFLNICNGNLRARAEAGGDPWGDDPACYLTDEEISP